MKKNILFLLAIFLVIITQNFPWECPECTFTNESHLVSCNLCNTKRPDLLNFFRSELVKLNLEYDALKRQFDTIAAKTTAEAEWKCKNCTFFNPISAEKCATCLQVKGYTPPEEKAPDLDGPTWSCLFCTLDNAENKNKCDTCETPAPCLECGKVSRLHYGKYHFCSDECRDEFAAKVPQFGEEEEEEEDAKPAPAPPTIASALPTFEAKKIGELLTASVDGMTVNVFQVDVSNQNFEGNGGMASCGYHTVKNALAIDHAFENPDSLSLLTDQGELRRKFGEVPVGEWRQQILDSRPREAKDEGKWLEEPEVIRLISSDKIHVGFGYIDLLKALTKENIFHKTIAFYKFFGGRGHWFVLTVYKYYNVINFIIADSCSIPSRIIDVDVLRVIRQTIPEKLYSTLEREIPAIKAKIKASLTIERNRLRREHAGKEGKLTMDEMVYEALIQETLYNL
ncbi:hypothetical protein HN446_01405 [bacterium]|jgi:hypothetical protein|nr:hypothetical protein [bacterium]